jgi:hypothetical protein
LAVQYCWRQFYIAWQSSSGSSLIRNLCIS